MSSKKPKNVKFECIGPSNTRLVLKDGREVQVGDVFEVEATLARHLQNRKGFQEVKDGEGRGTSPAGPVPSKPQAEPSSLTKPGAEG